MLCFCDSFTIPSVQHGNVIWDSLSFFTVLFNPKFNRIAELAWHGNFGVPSLVGGYIRDFWYFACVEIKRARDRASHHPVLNSKDLLRRDITVLFFQNVAFDHGHRRLRYLHENRE